MSVRSGWHADLARRAWRGIWPGLAGVLMVVAGPAAAQQCDARLLPVASTLRLDYDPFALARTTGRWSFDVESRSDQLCEVDLALVDDQHLGHADIAIDPSGVVIGIQAGPGDATPVPTASAGVWRVRLPPGRRTRLSLDATVTTHGVAPAGESATDLSLELRAPGSVVATGTALPVRIVLATVPRAQMNIVGAAGTFGEGASVTRVDFGVLETGAQRRVFLQVRANGRARLSIASANGGYLMRTDHAANEAGVPYQAAFDGRAVDLARGWAEEFEPPASLAGASLPLDLTLGTVGPRPAGRYSDLLTIELSAL